MFLSSLGCFSNAGLPNQPFRQRQTKPPGGAHHTGAAHAKAVPVAVLGLFLGQVWRSFIFRVIANLLMPSFLASSNASSACWCS